MATPSELIPLNAVNNANSSALETPELTLDVIVNMAIDKVSGELPNNQKQKFKKIAYGLTSIIVSTMPLGLFFNGSKEYAKSSSPTAAIFRNIFGGAENTGNILGFAGAWTNVLFNLGVALTSLELCFGDPNILDLKDFEVTQKTTGSAMYRAGIFISSNIMSIPFWIVNDQTTDPSAPPAIRFRGNLLTYIGFVMLNIAGTKEFLDLDFIQQFNNFFKLKLMPRKNPLSDQEKFQFAYQSTLDGARGLMIQNAEAFASWAITGESFSTSSPNLWGLTEFAQNTFKYVTTTNPLRVFLETTTSLMSGVSWLGYLGSVLLGLNNAMGDNGYGWPWAITSISLFPSIAFGFIYGPDAGRDIFDFGKSLFSIKTIHKCYTTVTDMKNYCKAPEDRYKYLQAFVMTATSVAVLLSFVTTLDLMNDSLGKNGADKLPKTEPFVSMAKSDAMVILNQQITIWGTIIFNGAPIKPLVQNFFRDTFGTSSKDPVTQANTSIKATIDIIIKTISSLNDEDFLNLLRKSLNKEENAPSLKGENWQTTVKQLKNLQLIDRGAIVKLAQNRAKFFNTPETHPQIVEQLFNPRDSIA